MIPITITPARDEKELRMFRKFILGQPQFYPDFPEWVDYKCIPRIESGQYKNIIAIENGIIVGGAVWRILGNEKVEIKNLRIDPKFRRRDIGHFLFRQIEAENPGKTLVSDVSVDNFSGVEFVILNGFHITGAEELYVAGRTEYLIEKKPIYH